MQERLLLFFRDFSLSMTDNLGAWCRLDHSASPVLVAYEDDAYFRKIFLDDASDCISSPRTEAFGDERSRLVRPIFSLLEQLCTCR